MSKPNRWWGITYIGRSMEVMPDTIRRTKREAIEACCESGSKWRGDQSTPAQWIRWKGRGCEAVRVIVTVEEKP